MFRYYHRKHQQGENETKNETGWDRQQETDKKACFKKQNKQAANLTKKNVLAKKIN